VSGPIGFILSVFCAEKTRLVLAYSDASEEFCALVLRAHKESSVMLKMEYEKLKILTKEAEMRADNARREMDRHIAGHGCGG
jgi:hypothetical protein